MSQPDKWEPSAELVEKAARAAYEIHGGSWDKATPSLVVEHRKEARAALIAARQDIIAEAVKAEAELDEALRDVASSLVAATHLLRNGGKKAAPSDKMFAIMLDDYEKSIAAARTILRARHP